MSDTMQYLKHLWLVSTNCEYRTISKHHKLKQHYNSIPYDYKKVLKHYNKANINRDFM